MKYKLEFGECDIKEIHGIEVDREDGYNCSVSICQVIFDPEFTYNTAFTAFVLCHSGKWKRFLKYIKRSEDVEKTVSENKDFIIKLSKEC